jgi:hypothetical protein
MKTIKGGRCCLMVLDSVTSTPQGMKCVTMIWKQSNKVWNMNNKKVWNSLTKVWNMQQCYEHNETKYEIYNDAMKTIKQVMKYVLFHRSLQCWIWKRSSHGPLVQDVFKRPCAERRQHRQGRSPSRPLHPRTTTNSKEHWAT